MEVRVPHHDGYRNERADTGIVLASIFTFAVTIHTILSHHRSNPFAGSGKALTFLRLGIEVLTFLLWIASATLLLRHKSGCSRREQAELDRNKKPVGPDYCWDGFHKDDKRKGILWSNRPSTTWDVAIAFSFIEM